MCVIIHKPANVTIGYKTLNHAWNTNSDGAGMVVVEDTKISMFKGFMTLLELSEAIKQYQKREIVLHFRLATHGAKTGVNTHPFECGEGYLFHNGVLSNFGEYGITGKSDSADLAETLAILKPIQVRKILDAINGKYAYVTADEVSLHGHFDKYKGLHCSNTYFDRTPIRSFNYNPTNWGKPKLIGESKKDTPTWDQNILLPYALADLDQSDMYMDADEDYPFKPIKTIDITETCEPRITLKEKNGKVKEMTSRQLKKILRYVDSIK